MDTGEGRIVLDRKAFGALAVDSRIKILKALRERRKMLTELSDELGLSASSTKEHLDTLADAGLVEKFDDGHKWKYYALTKKGSEIVTPDREIRVWVLLGLSVMGLLFSSLMMFGSGTTSAAVQSAGGAGSGADSAAPALAAGAQESGKAVLTSAPISSFQDNLTASVPPLPQPAPAEALQTVQASPFLIAGAICALILVGCLLYLAIRRTNKG